MRFNAAAAKCPIILAIIWNWIYGTGYNGW